MAGGSGRLWVLLVNLLAFAAVAPSAYGQSKPPTPDVAEARAVAFLIREVPAWSKNNGCFSCHHNGDGARALYAAARKGYRIPAQTLADTTAWVRQPQRWDQNKGDPGFSDKRLAAIQFAASLSAAIETGQVKERTSLLAAARKIAADQSTEGAWKVEPGQAVGSPATYGTPLATYMALRTLRQAGTAETQKARQAAEQWLEKAAPDNLPATAVLLMVVHDSTDAATRKRRQELLERLRTAQTAEGGWGPYADAPSEPFDTALALLALARMRREPGVETMLKNGRAFLAIRQNPDGSWPATTRPPGGDSYAQRVSTTAWATIALLETHP